MPEQIEMPAELNFALSGKIPGGGAPASGNKPNTIDLAAQSAAADAEIAAREAAQQGNQQQNQSNTDQKNENTESDEQIQAKLDTLSKKDANTLTEDEKAYIEKYTEPETTAVEGVQNLFREKYGLDFTETDKFEDSPEGLTQLIDTVAPRVANNMLLNYFQQYPLMEKFFTHVVQEGKSIETFMVQNTKPAFESVELREISSDMPEVQQKQLLENQKNLVTMHYKALGVDDESIQTLVENAEAGGKLLEMATKAKNALKAQHTAQMAAQTQAEEQRIAAVQAEQAQVVKLIETAISKNDFNGRNIPPQDLSFFKEAIFRRDGQGKSLLDYKREKMTLGDRLFLDYIVFKDFKVSNYIKPQEQSQKFKFSKLAKDNDNRNGGRTRNAGGSGVGGNKAQINPSTLGDIMNNALSTKTN